MAARQAINQLPSSRVSKTKTFFFLVLDTVGGIWMAVSFLLLSQWGDCLYLSWGALSLGIKIKEKPKVWVVITKEIVRSHPNRCPYWKIFLLRRNSPLKMLLNPNIVFLYHFILYPLAEAVKHHKVLNTWLSLRFSFTSLFSGQRNSSWSSSYCVVPASVYWVRH